MASNSLQCRCKACSNTFTPLYPEAHYCTLACAVTGGASQEEFSALLAARNGSRLVVPDSTPAPPTPAPTPSEQQDSHRSRPPTGSPAPPTPPVPPAPPNTPAEYARSTLSADTPTEYAIVTHDFQKTSDLVRDGVAWLASGQRYARLTERLTKSGEVIILGGYGCGLKVVRDALVVREGVTHDPQEVVTHTLQRGLHNCQQIICLNPTGSISFPALEWCRQQNITVILLGYDGVVLSTLSPSSDPSDATLRRRQYMAATDGTDVRIGHDILLAKFRGQLQTVCNHDRLLPGAHRAYEVLHAAISWLTLQDTPPWLSTLGGLRLYEGRVAAAYFGAWRDLPVRWKHQDLNKIPPHWRHMDTRNSPLYSSKSARHAADPVNSILNYAYSLLEGQCRHSLNSQGFDIACGFLHADKENRESLVHDLMEMERGSADSLVLGFLQSHILHYGDITRVVQDGSCRLHPELARAVVASCRVAQEAIDAHALWLRSRLLESGE